MFVQIFTTLTSKAEYTTIDVHGHIFFQLTRTSNKNIHAKLETWSKHHGLWKPALQKNYAPTTIKNLTPKNPTDIDIETSTSGKTYIPSTPLFTCVYHPARVEMKEYFKKLSQKHLTALQLNRATVGYGVSVCSRTVSLGFVSFWHFDQSVHFDQNKILTKVSWHRLTSYNIASFRCLRPTRCRTIAMCSFPVATRLWLSVSDTGAQSKQFCDPSWLLSVRQESSSRMFCSNVFHTFSFKFIYVFFNLVSGAFKNSWLSASQNLPLFNMNIGCCVCFASWPFSDIWKCWSEEWGLPVSHARCKFPHRKRAKIIKQNPCSEATNATTRAYTLHDKNEFGSKTGNWVPFLIPCVTHVSPIDKMIVLFGHVFVSHWTLRMLSVGCIKQRKPMHTCKIQIPRYKYVFLVTTCPLKWHMLNRWSAACLGWPQDSHIQWSANKP